MPRVLFRTTVNYQLLGPERRDNGPSSPPIARRFSRILIALLLALFLSSARAAADPPSFMGLGHVPGSTVSVAKALSADGSAVAGFNYSTGLFQGFRWTRSGGMTPLGLLPGGVLSIPYGVSADGSVISGEASASFSSNEAFRWTQASGLSALGQSSGAYHSGAKGVSADGSVVVGWYVNDSDQDQPFRWTQQDGMIGLGQLPGGYSSGALGLSADGSLIAGCGHNMLGQQEAFRWTQSEGMVGIGFLPDGSSFSCAMNVSADGSVIVGLSGQSPWVNDQAFRWTQADGMVGLGYLPGGNDSQATSVSADGSVIVGYGNSPLGLRAFLWTQANGLRPLADVLENDFGVNLSGWTLQTAHGISADGSTITGTGLNPTGDTEAWIAHIPEPSTLALFAACLPLATRSMRRRGGRSCF